jgi:small conductance mechanosensitive channel
MFTRDPLERATHTLGNWGGDFASLLPNLVVALIVLTAFIFLSKFVKRLVFHALKRFSKNVQVDELVAGVVRAAVIVAGLFVALGILKLDKTVTSLLAGVGVVGLVLGIAFKDIAANFMSGVMIAVGVPFEVGHLVQIKEYFGTVEALDLRLTVLRLPSGELVYIPNQDVLQSPLINWTKAGERRVDLTVGVAYGEDLEKVRRLALAAVNGISERDPAREAELFFTRFGDSSIELVVRFWIQGVAQSEVLQARSAALMAVKQAFDENQVAIPFPIRTLELGVRTGDKLDKMLAPATRRLPGNGSRQRAS